MRKIDLLEVITSWGNSSTDTLKLITFFIFPLFLDLSSVILRQPYTVMTPPVKLGLVRETPVFVCVYISVNLTLPLASMF